MPVLSRGGSDVGFHNIDGLVKALCQNHDMVSGIHDRLSNVLTPCISVNHGIPCRVLGTKRTCESVYLTSNALVSHIAYSMLTRDVKPYPDNHVFMLLLAPLCLWQAELIR